jgi:hypothetical protein
LILKRREFIRRSRPNMKKLLALLFTFAVAFSLAMPVFAQETSSQTSETTTTGKTVKKSKAAKTKAAKTKKAKTATTAAPTQ